MVSKLYLLPTMIFVSIATVFATCKKHYCAPITYNFRIGITATPASDSIFLTDTLWFTIDESNQLRDTSTNNIIDFSSAGNLSFVFGIRQVFSAQNVLPAAGSFNYIIKKGALVSSSDTSLLREFVLIEENNRYKLEVGFVPKQTGTYRVLVENSANVYLRNNSCVKGNFSVKFTNLDQHFYLGYNIWGDGVYYFKVR